jgi:uncharacterized protein
MNSKPQNNPHKVFNLFNIVLIIWLLSLISLIIMEDSLVLQVTGISLTIIFAFFSGYFYRRRSNWYIPLAILCGMSGLAAGIGIGIWFLLAGAVNFQAFAGICALVTGIIFTYYGIGALLRKMRLLWRIPSIVAAVLILAIILLNIAPALMATHVPQKPNENTVQDLGLSASEVTFPSPDGVTMHAWYVPSTNGAAVVLRHGSGSNALDVMPQARVLAHQGYGVLITDARGHGLSQGRAMDFGWFGDQDILGAVTFLTSQNTIKANKIAVMGMSMGGEEAIGAAAADPRIAAVIAEGASARTDEDKEWLAESFGWRGQFQLVMERIQYGIAGLMTEAAKPTPLAKAASASSPRPMLLICAGAIEDEALAAEHIRATSPDNVTVWVVPGAGHIQGLAVAQAEWESRVIAFLSKTIGP